MARNLFRDWNTGKLSKPDLRIAAVYRLMRKGRITSQTRAAELLAERGVKPAVIGHWIAGPFKHLPIAR
jgi:predicted GTPase